MFSRVASVAAAVLLVVSVGSLPANAETGSSASLVAGGRHSLAMTADGTAWAWGENLTGQLGDGTTTDRLDPTEVPSFHDVTQVAAGWYHSLAVRENRTTWSWGWNRDGQLGNGGTQDVWTPRQVVWPSAGTETVRPNPATDLRSTAADRRLRR